MKWNILVGSVVLGLGLCSQSFGFELLDRMLGVNGGCCESSCCEKASCCEAAPACGCEAAAPACGCEAAPCCETKCCRKPLFNFNFKRCCKPKCDSCCDAAPACGCEVAAPACGCETACAPKCCKPKCCRSLLDRIFVCNKRCCKKSCCDTGCGCAAAAPGCGCEAGGHAAPAPALDGGDMPPMPPAPVVDPSAFVPSQRRVVHASTGSYR